MTVISVCNHKGGSGKTTATIHIAAALSLVGYRVLTIDLDPQGFLTRLLGLEEPKRPEDSSWALFDMDAAFSRLSIQKLKSFDFLPSSTALTKKMKDLGKSTDVFWIREVLYDCNDYDFILIDSSSAVTVYTLNSLVASQYAIIPVVPEYLPIKGAEQTYESCNLVRQKLNPELNPPFFLMTQVDHRKKGHENYRNYLNQHYPNAVLNTQIRTCPDLANEIVDGKTVFQANMKSKGAQDFALLIDELLNIMDRDDKKAAVDIMLGGKWKSLFEISEVS